MGPFFLYGVEDHIVISVPATSQGSVLGVDERATTHSALTEQKQFVFSVDGETDVEAVTGCRYHRVERPGIFLSS